MNIRIRFASAVLAGAAAVMGAGTTAAPMAQPAIPGLPPPSGILVRRLTPHPIITPAMLPDDPIVNIDGPSLILAPAWLPNRLGKYYLYFANHRGPEIHLAYADRLEGPWRIHRPGPVSVFQVAAVNGETTDVHRHAASPDIYVDNARRQIRMYFHFRLPKLGHVSTVATSSDGLHFAIQPGTIGEPYLRVFRHDGWFYFIDRSGRLLRSRDGFTGFQVGTDAVGEAAVDPATGASLRHTGLRLVGNRLQIFYSRVGDAPESILVSTMPLTGDWLTWRPSPPLLVLAPGTPDEGTDLPITPSDKGDAKGRQRQLRDPYIYEENGHVYLLYAVAGEHGIAIAELTEPRNPLGYGLSRGTP